MKKSLFVALPMALAIVLTGCGADTEREAVAASDPGISATVESAPPSSSPSDAVKATKSAETPKGTDKPKPKATPEAKAPTAGSSAITALNALKVADETGNDSYDRELFNHWTNGNGSGCDTRFAVLQQESKVKTKISGCKVISGEWFSSYDNVTVTDPKKLDIDHMVPLKEAWKSGAHGWDSDTREAYANDMDYADSLIAVTAGSNRSKSDRDPANWMPPASDTHCEYVADWISVKTRWKLTVDAQEKAAIADVLDSCGDAKTEKVASAPVGKGEASASKATQKSEAPKTSAPKSSTGGGTDPDMGSCSKATAAGYGPYTKGQAEYEFYRDGDGDGTVCE